MLSGIVFIINANQNRSHQEICNNIIIEGRLIYDWLIKFAIYYYIKISSLV